MRSIAAGLSKALRSGRQLYRDRPWVLDAVVAVAMFAVCVIWVSHYPYEPDGRHVYSVQDVHHVPFRPIDPFGYALTALACFAIALRRWLTAPVMLATCAVIAVYTGFDYPPTTIAWSPLLIFYTLCTRAEPWRTEPWHAAPWRVTPYAAVLLAVWLQYSLELQVLGVLLAVVQSVLVIAVTWVFGDKTRRLAERNQRLALLTAELRREQVARAERAVAGERVRIARELHDVVAHHLSVISVQVGLARYVLASDAKTAGQAVDAIADATHEGLREMRRMLAVLRPDDARGNRHGGRSAKSTPGLSGLGALLERVRAGGVEAELSVVGEPFPLPPGPDLCCYRVAQESLTNVMKHASGAEAVVELWYQDHDVILRVADDGGRVGSSPYAERGGPPAPEVEGTGNGLVGMRERARIYGGTLTAGHRAAGGFEVVLTLPFGRDREARDDRDDFEA